MVEVKYKNTVEQWVEFNIYKVNNSIENEKSVKIRRTLALGIGLLIGVLYCILALQDYIKGNSPIFSIILGIIFAGLGIFGYYHLPAYWDRRAKKLLKESFEKNERELGRNITVTLENEKLMIYKNKSKKEILLDSVVNVIISAEFLGIILSNDRDIIIPLQAFTSQEDRVKFEKFIKKCCENNKREKELMKENIIKEKEVVEN
ncbi:YcxB family protein [Clostridium weizhouense]|uniref:YcxB family protein n=1 Tax=Clostridium weizhouense TaxID=2859781 RepID=A0ABS7AQ38_9CLOT|nr:YcxB family protein [Clostridium weizhouense]MBW6410781.1 YcxB family protein [Clostridium weizhouense]